MRYIWNHQCTQFNEKRSGLGFLQKRFVTISWKTLKNFMSLTDCQPTSSMRAMKIVFLKNRILVLRRENMMASIRKENARITTRTRPPWRIANRSSRNGDYDLCNHIVIGTAFDVAENGHPSRHFRGPRGDLKVTIPFFRNSSDIHMDIPSCIPSASKTLSR